MRRGDGVGLEITTNVVRGVRLAHDAAGRIAAVTEIPITTLDDDGRVYDALVRARGQLGTHQIPTRVSWFPTRSTLQRLDVTGLTGPELNSLRTDLEREFSANSTMLIDSEARRWMLAMRWDYSGAWRLQELAERAGFVDVAIEPSPVALQRVLPNEVAIARRDASGDRSWAALYAGSVPVAAVSVAAGSREAPRLDVATTAEGFHRLTELLSEAELGDVAAALVDSALRDESRHGGDTAQLATSDALSILGEPYPPYLDHDLRAPQRVAVALGSAVGAAGLAGRLRPVDVMSPSPDAGGPKPWAIERVMDESMKVEPAAPSTLTRAFAKLRIRSRS